MYVHKMKTDARYRFREARLGDAEQLFQWRSDPLTRAASHNSTEFRWDEHLKWLEATFSSPDRRLLIAEDDSGPVGTVRLDREAGVWLMSWTVAPERRGTGVGSEIVASIVDRMLEPLRAEIKIDNVASRRIAEKAGLNLIAAAGEILVYYRGPA
jgi:RimJ/RimL family protein N-acetyltransferase